MNKDLGKPLELPITLEISSDNNSITLNGVSIPLSIPFSLSIGEHSSISSSKGFSLPFSLPYSLGKHETSNGRTRINKKIITTEQAWVFQGIVFDEYVIAKMNKNVTFVEEVKSRILTEVTLVDRNHLKINWFGNELETVKIYKKLDIDDKYETDDKEIPWRDKEVILTLGDGSYNIYIDTPNKSGISDIINILDTNYNKVKSDLKIALNEKTHYLNVDFKQTFNIKIDF